MEIKNNTNRLEPHLNQLKVEQGQERAVAEKASAPVAAKLADTVELKSPGLKNVVAEAAQGAPDVRQGRVDAIKAQVADGSYNIDSKAIAGKMLESARELF